MAEQALETFDSCEICGRTILRGERISEYVTPDGERRRVCSLCKMRAESAGWIPAELAGSQPRPSERRRRGTALRAALGRAAERMRQPRREPEAAVAGAEGEWEEPSREPAPAPPAVPIEPDESQPSGQPPRPPSEPSQPPAAAEGAKPSRRSQRSTVERRLRRAVECFNESDQSRVVAGLLRTLGEPRASVASVSAKPSRVAVTVAWELSWYRWEVAEDGEDASVREVAKGDEVAQLAEEAKRWNATVDAEGRLRLASARSSRAASKATE